jgi:phage replication initiation protein
LFGSACLHVSRAKWREVAEYVEARSGWLTRCDLALDIWQGVDLATLPGDYLRGRFDVRGQRPKQREAGSWTSGHSRTFYVGRRETGKELRAYEKGDELFGPEVGDPWVRIEVEFRNNARVLDCDMLRRPGDFFAGAYPYCERVLADEMAAAQLARCVAAQRIPAGRKVKDATVTAAVQRSLRWLERVAMPSVRAAFSKAPELFDAMLLQDDGRAPGRLRGWTFGELAQGFAHAKQASEFGRFAPLPSH